MTRGECDKVSRLHTIKEPHVMASTHKPSPLPSPEVDPLVVSELAVRHIAMVPDDLPHVLRRHVLFLRLHEPELPFLAVPLRLQLLPFACCSERNTQTPLMPCYINTPVGLEAQDLYSKKRAPTFFLQLVLAERHGGREGVSLPLKQRLWNGHFEATATGGENREPWLPEKAKVRNLKQASG